MQKNTEHILNRDDVSTAILQHLDGLRGIDTHCHHLPDDPVSYTHLTLPTILRV